jgi:hypothetical protein
MIWQSPFWDAFTYIAGSFIAIGVACDKYIRSEFKKEIWDYMVEKPNVLSQSYFRDFAKSYLQHTAFRLFSHHPLSWDSFRKSAIITISTLPVLFLVYYSINGFDTFWVSFATAHVVVILILGVIIVDYLSNVLTLYVMRSNSNTFS